MSPQTTLWCCAAAPALDVGDVGASMQAFRDRREAVQRAQSGRVPASSAGPAQQDDTDEEALDRVGSACGSGSIENGGGASGDGSGSEAPSEAAVEDDLDRMESAAETMRLAKPPKSPRICTHDEWALKVKSHGEGHATGQLVCLEHALQLSMLFDLMRAVLQMDESVIMQYLQAQKDQGEEFGLCLDRTFAHFCTQETRPLDAVPIPAYAGTWKRDAGTLATLARNMRILLKGMKRDVGRTQLQAMQQQHPHMQVSVLELRDRIHALMHDHQQQQEEDQLMLEMQEMEAIHEKSRAGRYLDEEATEDPDSENENSDAGEAQ